MTLNLLVKPPLTHQNNRYSGTRAEYNKEIALWWRMIKRCYSEKYQTEHPTYVGCHIDEEFYKFYQFIAWAKQQIGYGLGGYQLDKDILIRGNKVYSPTTCVFVPQEINKLFTKRNLDRGPYPIGVTLNKKKGKFNARISTSTGRRCLGYFKTPEEAFGAYKEAKEDYIKVMANLYRNKIDARVYEVMMMYEVFITD